MSTGYSGTPLAKKLGYKPGIRVFLDGAPAAFGSLLDPLPEGVEFVPRHQGGLDMIHLFCDRAEDLHAKLKRSLKSVKPDGMIWVSWPKKASKVPTDLTEDAVRGLALPLGLVDVKVCAVDEIWSGLKLVIRVENR